MRFYGIIFCDRFKNKTHSNLWHVCVFICEIISNMILLTIPDGNPVVLVCWTFPILPTAFVLEVWELVGVVIFEDVREVDVLEKKGNFIFGFQKKDKSIRDPFFWIPRKEKWMRRWNLPFVCTCRCEKVHNRIVLAWRCRCYNDSSFPWCRWRGLHFLKLMGFACCCCEDLVGEPTQYWCIVQQRHNNYFHGTSLQLLKGGSLVLLDRRRSVLVFASVALSVWNRKDRTSRDSLFGEEGLSAGQRGTGFEEGGVSVCLGRRWNVPCFFFRALCVFVEFGFFFWDLGLFFGCSLLCSLSLSLSVGRLWGNFNSFSG